MQVKCHSIAEHDLQRLLDLMAREMARLLAAERASVFL
jgi:hypothetical protein